MNKSNDSAIGACKITGVKQMGIADIFRDIVRDIQIWPDREMIASTLDALEKSFRQVGNEKKKAGHRLNMATNEDMAGWSGNAIRLFKESMEDPNLAFIVAKYPDRMQQGIFMHSHRSKYFFHEAAEEVAPEGITDLVQYIIGNKTFRNILRIHDGGSNGLMEALEIMVRKCSVEDKVRLFKKLDSGLLNDVWNNGAGMDHVATFVVAAFEGTETKAALDTLKHSNAWKNYPKTGNLREALCVYDQRLLPALQYTNEPGQQPSPER